MDDPVVLEIVFRHRYEQFLGRVHRFIHSRASRDRNIESLVERILVETLDDWMGPGEDDARAARVLAHARNAVAGCSEVVQQAAAGVHPT